MKSLLAPLIGANRPKVIAVLGNTRAEVERGVRHARTGSEDLPVWAWCGEDCSDQEPVAGCTRFASGAAALRFSEDLREVWPALSIVAWTGKPGPLTFKLLPLAIPPFRVVLFNEAEGYFAARPAAIARHVVRRSRDACAAKIQLAGDHIKGASQWIAFWTALWLGRAGDRIRDLFNWILSLAWRSGERIRDVCNWIRESFFALLAFAAHGTAPLSYEAVQRARHGRPSPLRLKEAFDSSFIEVTIPNRGWPRRAIVSAARSGAEFIVLRRPGERDSAASLISIARQTNAFAVAKQIAHAAWRRQVVNKHPFRQLQEEEITEVFAPWSALLVIRREALVRLGVPRALTYGGALLTLFWKSAAADLRSYVAGSADPVTDEPGMALEDAELALRLSTSRSLADAGPPRPARLRGNVAWSPAYRLPFRPGKPRVLVVSPYLPFPLSHGGAVRIYNLCRSLAGQIDFVLACFHEAGEAICYDQLHQIFREVYVVDADEQHSDPAVPKQVAEYRNTAMADLIRGLCLDRKVDLVQLEYTQMAEYRDQTGAIPVILVEHDITLTLYAQLADFHRDPRIRRDYYSWLDFERAALQCSSMVWTMSTEERSTALSFGASRTRSRVIPNGVDLERFVPAPKPAGPQVVLFIGSFRHLPNLLAFECLLRSIMPEVWRQSPDALLHVVAGPHHERAANLAGKAELLQPDTRIVIEGFVEDVRPAYRSADVVAVPLPLSAGTNIKLLEAMACGRAIVSTLSGCRGLDLTHGRELIVAELDSSFSGAIVELLRDGKLRTELARNARHTAEMRFGWDTIAQDALDSYAELTFESPSVRQFARAGRQTLAQQA